MDSAGTPELARELELLAATYDPAQLRISPPGAPRTLTFYAEPQVGADASRIFASVTLTASIPAKYPAAPAEYSLARARAVDDAALAELSAALAAAARDAAAVRELHVGLALDATREWLTERNVPGDCPVCFEPVSARARGADGCVRLESCLHALHARCFLPYVRGLGDRRLVREKELQTTVGAREAARLAALQCQYSCPVCRVVFDFTAAHRVATEEF